MFGRRSHASHRCVAYCYSCRMFCVCVSLCVGLYISRWTDREPVCGTDSCGSMEPCRRTLAPAGEYDWTICARQRCGLMSGYFDRLFSPALAAMYRLIRCCTETMADDCVSEVGPAGDLSSARSSVCGPPADVVRANADRSVAWILRLYSGVKHLVWCKSQGWGPRGLSSTSKTTRGQKYLALALA